MARIVLGMAIPHSGMLGKSPETWVQDGERDHRNQGLVYRNRVWTYPELKAARDKEGFVARVSLEDRMEQGRRCAQAMEVLRKVYAENKPDVVVMIGKDQKEIFTEISPALAIYTGENIESGPPQKPAWGPDQHHTHAAHPELAMHLIKAFQRNNFDMTEIIKWPKNAWLQNTLIVPHAFSFIYHQIMNNDPPPNVPVFVNTFYAPNQPSMSRCLQFSKALYEAITAWDSDKTVAIIASGGMSHFVCDEQLDQQWLSCFRNYDFEGLASISEASYQSGNSEVKLYVPVMWAMQQLGASTQVVDYVPCYRTEAGTGEGCGFMYWVPPLK